MNLESLVETIKLLDLSAPSVNSDDELDYFLYYGINFSEHFSQIVHHFGYIPSGEFNIATHFFDNKEAKKTCFIVHGYYDHTGLYGHLIKHCLEQNYSVVVFDLPGHGLSTGERASIASFAHYQSVLSDVIAFFSKVATKPWHIVGQSTGAAIVMDFLLSKNASTFERAVLLAPLVRPKRWLISRISHSVVRLLKNRVHRRFGENSSDRFFLEFLKGSDPLQSKYLPLQWVVALKQWIKYFIKLSSVDFVPLVVQGKLDDTVDWQYNIGIIKQKFPDTKFLYLDNGRHQLVNESPQIRQLVFSAMDDYFQSEAV